MKSDWTVCWPLKASWHVRGETLNQTFQFPQVFRGLLFPLKGCSQQPAGQGSQRPLVAGRIPWTPAGLVKQVDQRSLVPQHALPEGKTGNPKHLLEASPNSKRKTRNALKHLVFSRQGPTRAKQHIRNSTSLNISTTMR